MPASDRSTNASSLILRTRPTSLAAADRKATGGPLSTRISIVAPVSTRAGTDRQRYSAHAPSSNATNVLGCGRPLAIKQLGSTADEPSVHHNISGSYSEEKRADNT